MTVKDLGSIEYEIQDWESILDFVSPDDTSGGLNLKK
jgi:hypothetical protein